MVRRARRLLATGTVALATIASPAAVHADVEMTIDTSADRRPISPLVYGINGSTREGAPFASLLSFARPGLVRLGGNRWTAYNWENNASNAGSDYQYQNDGYLSESTTPGEAVLPTVRAAAAIGAATMVTIPNVDYVAADRNGGGDIRLTPNHQDTRLHDNAATGGPMTTTPNTGDGTVFQDQFAYWLRQSAPAGARVLFSLDNEPDLWSETHPEVHPQKVGYAELGDRNERFARRLKEIWPEAPVTGPVNYGFSGYETLQDAPDRQGKGNFLSWWLARMASASGAAGRRIVDDLDLHWYPEAQGGGKRVTGADTSPDVVAARLQAPRSLWDPAYVEDSWITRDYLPQGDKAIRLIPRVGERIAASYPGTGLAFTEWNYGGSQHISGGIATADVLGVFGRHGVSAAAYWPLQEDNAFAYAAFAMFRNFDGNGAAFGDTSVRATTSDVASSSVYASVDAADPSRVVVVAINKSAAPQTARIALQGGPEADRARVFTLTAGPDPRPAAGPDLQASPRSTFACSMPGHSVSVVVPEPLGAPAPGDPPPGPSGPGGPAPPSGSPDRLTLARLLALPSSRRCVRRLRLTLRPALRSQVRSVSVKVGKRRARVFRGRALRRPLRVTRVPRGRFGVRITVTLKDGRKVTATKRYRRCRGR